MRRTPRRPDAHGAEFLGVRGSRTLQNSDGSESENSVEDPLDLNTARAAGRRASKSILAAANDTLKDLWDAMAEYVTDEHAALREEREPLQAALNARRAESSLFEAGRGRSAEKELEKRIKAHEDKELKALAVVDAKIDAVNREYSERASCLIARRSTSMSDAASDRLKSVLARIAAQQAEDDRRDAAIEFQKRNKESRAAERIPKGGSGNSPWTRPVQPGVSLPAAGVVEVQCLRCKKAWHRRFGEIYYTWSRQKDVSFGCPNKLCSGIDRVHTDWGTRFRDAEGKASSFD